MQTSLQLPREPQARFAAVAVASGSRGKSIEHLLGQIE